MSNVQGKGSGLNKRGGFNAGETYGFDPEKETQIVTGDGICLTCCGVKRHAIHCKIYCSECGTMLVNCNGD